jgi:hypothetical protein
MTTKLSGPLPVTHMQFIQHHFLNFLSALAQSPWLLAINDRRLLLDDKAIPLSPSDSCDGL